MSAPHEMTCGGCGHKNSWCKCPDRFTPIMGRVSAATCPYCGSYVRLKRNGTMVAHYSRMFFGGEPEPWCFGSGRRP